MFAGHLRFRQGQRIQAGADLLDRLEGDIGQESGEDQRADDGYPGISQSGDQPGLDDEAQESRAHAHAHGGEGLGVLFLFQGQGQVIDPGWSKDDFQQFQQTAALQFLIFLAVGQRMVQVGGVSTKQGSPFTIGDRHVEDGRGVADG